VQTATRARWGRAKASPTRSRPPLPPRRRELHRDRAPRPTDSASGGRARPSRRATSTATATSTCCSS
jgi:hypothetical protein